MTNEIIRADDLILGYGTTIAVDRSSFIIPKGAVTAVIGPNGSGKSTLLNALAGLRRPIDGTISTDVPPTDMAYVLQATRVNEHLPISVNEVVAMGRYANLGPYRWLGPEDRHAVETAMERLGITDLAHDHLDQLSGGQRQRVFVAQGLAQEHTVLLLDEPLTGIDLTTAQAIDAVIHAETTEGRTVVMTTHDISEAQNADHVLLLAGRVVASGPPADVLTRENLTAAYGASLLHVDDAGRFFLDDPAHTHTTERHVHRDRTIHTEVSHEGDLDIH